MNVDVNVEVNVNEGAEKTDVEMSNIYMRRVVTRRVCRRGHIPLITLKLLTLTGSREPWR